MHLYLKQRVPIPNTHLGPPRQRWRGPSKASLFGSLLALLIAAIPLSNVYAEISHFDGAGSLISPEQDCWGCNKDAAMMHGHGDNQGKPSTVVFQWLNSPECDHIDIHTEPDIGKVVVRAKAWSDHLTQTAYKSTLPVSVEAEGKWNTVAITSTIPVKSVSGEKVMVSADCKPQSESKKGRKTEVSKDLVGFDFDYYWTGNGSVISQAGTGFGKDKDLAVTFHSHKSLTVFQWYTESSCRRLKLSDKSGQMVGLYGEHDGVSFKKWDEKSWSLKICDSLPCTLEAPDSRYYIVKIKSEANALLSGELMAECL